MTGNPADALPQPSAAFHWDREGCGLALHCGELGAHAQHLFSSRQLRLQAADEQSNVWAAAARMLDRSPDVLLRARQVHGNTIRLVRQDEDLRAAVQSVPDADAIVSDARGALLSVQIADCVPLLLADVHGRAAAAVHAGWRGTAAGIAAGVVRTLRDRLGVSPENLIVAVGPSIGSCCYTVGPELIEGFRAGGASDAQLARWFSRAADDALRLDLWRANQDQLVAVGVPAERIHVSGLCTRTHAQVFDSYRAHGARAGRSVAMIRVGT